MKKIICWLSFITIVLFLLSIGYFEKWFVLKTSMILPFKSIIASSFGGVLYLFRSIYINKCVKNQWDIKWELWYYIRPITSVLSGIASYIFLKAGVLILNSEMITPTSSYGFIAVAFIAGLNVDKFIAKLEDLAKSTWGIDKSRMNKEK